MASYQTAIDAMLLLMNQVAAEAISPHLPTSPHISADLPISPHISQVEEEAIGHDRTVMLPALSLPCSALHEAARCYPYS